MTHDIKPGDTVYNVISSIYEDGSRLQYQPKPFTVDRLDRDDSFWALDAAELRLGRYWMEYVCTSPLGHLGMPCIFCGQAVNYFRCTELDPERFFHYDNEGEGANV